MPSHLTSMQTSLHRLAAALAAGEDLGPIGQALHARLDSPALRELITRKRQATGAARADSNLSSQPDDPED